MHLNDLEDPAEASPSSPRAVAGGRCRSTSRPRRDRREHAQPRPAGRPRQLRRHPGLDEPRRPQRGDLGSRRRHQPEGDVLLLGGGGTVDAGRRRRLDHQRLVRRRSPGLRNLAAYAASKGGINALTVQLAVELAPDRIRVNAFAPGATNVQRNLDDDPSYRETWSPLIPLGRIAEPEDMVGPTVFLASEESAHVTGQLFYVDGGWTSVGGSPRGTPTSRNASSASVDTATSAAAEPGFRAAAERAAALDDRVAGDRDRVPAPRARGHALAGQSRDRWLRRAPPTRRLWLARRRRGRPLEPQAADDRGRWGASGRDRDPGRDDRPRRVSFWQIVVVAFIEGTGPSSSTPLTPERSAPSFPESSSPRPWA